MAFGREWLYCKSLTVVGFSPNKLWRLMASLPLLLPRQFVVARTPHTICKVTPPKLVVAIEINLILFHGVISHHIPMGAQSYSV